LEETWLKVQSFCLGSRKQLPYTFKPYWWVSTPPIRIPFATSQTTKEVRAVEFIQNKSPEMVKPVGGEIPSSFIRGAATALFGWTSRAFDLAVISYTSYKSKVVNTSAEVTQHVKVVRNVSLVAGCITGFSCYTLLTALYAKNRSQRPYVYGTKINRAVARPGQALQIAGPAPAVIDDEQHISLEDNSVEGFLFGPRAVDNAPGLRRRKQYCGVDDQGNHKWKDFPRDNNSDNGPNRVYEYDTAFYRLPRLAFFGVLRQQFLSFSKSAPETWGRYLMLEDDHVVVELPVDTVENLKKWWSTVGMCDENIDISFVKANEITRNLALSAQDCHTVVLFSATVALLSVKEFNEFKTLHHCKTVMSGDYYTSRTAQLNSFMFQEALTIKPVRVALSVIVGLSASIAVFSLSL